MHTRTYAHTCIHARMDAHTHGCEPPDPYIHKSTHCSCVILHMMHTRFEVTVHHAFGMQETDPAGNVQQYLYHLLELDPLPDSHGLCGTHKNNRNRSSTMQCVRTDILLLEDAYHHARRPQCHNRSHDTYTTFDTCCKS